TNGKSANGRRSDRFLAGLKDVTSVTFVSHVHPDPDSLGSMIGLAHLAETCLQKPTRLTRSGLVSPAENLTLVDMPGSELVPVKQSGWGDGAVLVMVDSEPNTGRHNFGPTVPLSAVIDHRDTPGDLEGVPFVDVRRGLGATCSLVVTSIIEQEIAVPPQ